MTGLVNGRFAIRILLCVTTLAGAMVAKDARATLSLAPRLCPPAIEASAPAQLVVTLDSRPFNSTRGGSLGKRFGETLGFSPLDRDVERKYRDAAVAFARATGRDCVVHRNSDGTTLKMDIGTGNLLVVSKAGHVAMFTRLPTRNLPSSSGSLRELFDSFSGTLERPAGRFVVRWPRLTADAALDANRFLPSLREPKFKKHVVEREEFGNRFVSPAEYERAAVAFANDRTRASLVVTQLPRNGVDSVQSMKFDPITSEFVVVDRVSGDVITYYRGDLVSANAELSAARRIHARNLFEYLLFGRDFHGAPISSTSTRP